MKALTASVLVCVLASIGVCGEPLAWPQFRGPGGAGVAEGQNPPVEFGPTDNVKWKVAVPAGNSSPIVAGDNLILTAIDGGKFYTIAYSRASGREAWRTEAPANAIERYYKIDGSPANSTPATDGTRIVTYFGSCGLFCYDLAGRELWRFEMPTVVTAGDFGTGVSPVLAGDAVILVRDSMEDPKILALDIATGKVRWETKREPRPGFGTPAVCDTPAGKQIAVAGFGRMVGYDLKTGEQKWTVAGMPSVSCTTPIVQETTLYYAGWSPGEDVKPPSFDEMLKASGEENLGFITRDGFDKTPGKGMFDHQDSNHDGKLTREEWDAILKILFASKNSAFALKLGGSGDVTKTNVLWRQTKGLPYVPSGIVYRDQYVIVKDGGLVTAFDTKTGEPLYAQKRVVANDRYYASPVAANGLIYFTCLSDGRVTVLKAGAKAPEVVAQNPSLEESVAATPAIADDTLYVRTAEHLYAFARKE